MKPPQFRCKHIVYLHPEKAGMNFFKMLRKTLSEDKLNELLLKK